MATSREILHGVSTVKDLPTPINPHTTDDDIHRLLLRWALDGNQSLPVAARYQQNPAGVATLTGHNSRATLAARSGLTYQLTRRPSQKFPPRPTTMSNDQRAFTMTEINRLLMDCQAIERCPEHDGHKPLSTSCAPFERSAQPIGNWPREPRVPVLLPHETSAYHQKMTTECKRRTSQGKPRRDFESRVFTVGKSDGGFRLCTDLRALNDFVPKSKFQMEGVQQLAQMIRPNDFGMLVDIKDCFLELGLHPSQRRYFRFRSPDGTRYQWRTICFGASEAPKICTKLMRPLIEVLKCLGIRCLIYIDDLIIIDQDRVRLARSMIVAMNLLQRKVGLQLKTSKCNFRPSQNFTALGFIWNTKTMKVSVPTKRITAMQRCARRMATHADRVTVRDMARFVGQAISTNRAIDCAKRRLLFLQHALAKGIRTKGWHGCISLHEDAISALQWWASPAPLQHNSNDIMIPTRPFDVMVKSDAAGHNRGHGGILIYKGKTYRTRGFFDWKGHINEFELAAFIHTVRSLLPIAEPDRSKWNLIHIHGRLDNTPSIKYGRVAVSRSLKMSKIGAAFYDWRIAQNLRSISLSHIPGVENVEADALSRTRSSHIDWKLNPIIFRRIARHVGVHPDVDLFAAAHNTQTKRFFAWNHDHQSIGTDAMVHDWTGLGILYAYPPPILIGRVLQKCITERIPLMILIAPAWPAQHWHPTLLDMMTQPPLILHQHPSLTEDPLGEPMWPCRWHLLAWTLSGDLLAAKASRRRHLIHGGTCRRTVIRPSTTSRSKTSEIGGTALDRTWTSVQNRFDQESSPTT